MKRQQMRMKKHMKENVLIHPSFSVFDSVSNPLSIPHQDTKILLPFIPPTKEEETHFSPHATARKRREKSHIESKARNE